MTADEFVPNINELLGHNRAYANDFDGGSLQVAPTRRLAVVACMDSRIDSFKILGLESGESHIIRNAGGVVTDDVIRSLCLSQRFMGTREIVLVHHTDCGLEQVNEDDFKQELQDELGLKPRWSLESFRDPYADVRQSIQRLHVTPFIAHKDLIRGFVYDVTDGLLHPVD